MDFDNEFVMELFLDDSVTTINRLVVATANVLSENNENITKINEVLKKEQKNLTLHPVSKKPQAFENSSVRKVKGFYDNVVYNYSDEEYLEKLYMKKSTVQALITFLKGFVNSTSSIVPLDKKVHVFLWLLTSEASFNEVGALFKLNKSSVSYIFHEIATLLSEQRYHFISWPSLEEQHVTRVKVHSLHKFPNCIGFIDACRFRVGSKRNKRTAPDPILLQAVCDESYMFIDIHIGSIGITRKSRVFKESHLAQELKNFIDFDNHILGDSEYKLRKNLITPFTSDEVLTSEEMKFNEIHWKTRAYIGHALEMLKDRFRRLNHIDSSKPETINAVICAACVLHNFILLHEGCALIKEEVTAICEDGVTLDSNLVKTAVEKRQFLCNYINYIDGT